MNTEQLDAIQARADAATEGPYVLARYDHGGGRMFAQTASGERGVLVADTFKVGDREFYAEARAYVLTLLALVRSQQAQIERVANLHAPIAESDNDEPYCRHCKQAPYPCPTIAALTATEGA